MPDDLYERDILSWSQHQADLLRRVARGERVNNVDWAHVVEEIEDVGLSELHAVESFLDLMLVHLLKVCGWPESSSVRDWRMEIGSFQKNAARRFAPSMRQRIDLAKLYGDALEQLEGADYDDTPPRRWAATCPVTLDDLLTERRAVLEQRFAEISEGA
jgi:antitoxin (DNA-binding transcriptional repressor) of toxin-antitoxin stability system